mmetsp:Transcript_18950/g.36863  ORF Transcript_18950/g.36863 Transcript_18950/m.36863 type:complete len:264 (-) Transcript_18950:716-1507(-)
MVDEELSELLADGEELCDVEFNDCALLLELLDDGLLFDNDDAHELCGDELSDNEFLLGLLDGDLLELRGEDAELGSGELDDGARLLGLLDAELLCGDDADDGQPPTMRLGVPSCSPDLAFRAREGERCEWGRALCETDRAMAPRAAPGRRSGSASSADAKNITNVYAPDKIAHNTQAVEYVRTFLSIAGGIATGIAGYTGLTGLMCFFLTNLLVSLWVLTKAGGSPSPYFQSVNGEFLGGMMGGFGSFVLFWTMANNAVHIYG